MSHWESLVDRKIREAMDAGEFDNLPGKGRPVDTSENPFEDPELRIAHRLLRDAGFAPAWIEERKEIDAELEAALTILARGWRLLRRSPAGNCSSAESLWQRSVSGFVEKVATLNRRIESLNLQVPAAVFQRRKIDVERELRELAEKL